MMFFNICAEVAFLPPTRRITGAAHSGANFPFARRVLWKRVLAGAFDAPPLFRRPPASLFKSRLTLVCDPANSGRQCMTMRVVDDFGLQKLCSPQHGDTPQSMRVRHLKWELGLVKSHEIVHRHVPDCRRAPGAINERPTYTRMLKTP